MMDEFNIEASMREDIYALVEAAWKKAKENEGGEELDGESERLLEKERKSYITNGLGIEKGVKRDRFKEIKKRLSQVCFLWRSILNVRVGIGFELMRCRSKLSSRRTSTRRMAVSGSHIRNWRVCLRMSFLDLRLARVIMRGS